MSGRTARATSMVRSVERPSTRITSSTSSGSRSSTQATLRSSLSVGITTLTRVGVTASRSDGEGESMPLAVVRKGSSMGIASFSSVVGSARLVYAPAATDLTRGLRLPLSSCLDVVRIRRRKVHKKVTGDGMTLMDDPYVGRTPRELLLSTSTFGDPSHVSARPRVSVVIPVGGTSDVASTVGRLFGLDGEVILVGGPLAPADVAAARALHPGVR